MEGNALRGFKVFNPDWTCRGKQYTCPGKFKEDVTLVVREQGMHFCKRAVDCFNYYNFNPENKVAEVEACGTVVEEGEKCCTDKLEIIREIPWKELLEIVNMGKGCTGLCNSGDQNRGNWNSGNSNSGDWNSGDRNSGNRNSGSCNSGDRNSGNRNSGNSNSGDWNSGDWNSGDWNKTNFSNGCFNTVEAKIHLFNKPSEWTYQDWLNSDARYLLDQIPGGVLEYIWLDDMTDEEKAAHPDAEAVGMYMRKNDAGRVKRMRQEWWNDLDVNARAKICGIPNFDAKIFREITGIDVDNG